MNGPGISFRDVSSDLKEMYDADISHATLRDYGPHIPAIKEWQARSWSQFIPSYGSMLCVKSKEAGQSLTELEYHNWLTGLKGDYDYQFEAERNALVQMVKHG